MGDQPHLQRNHSPDDAVPRTLAAGFRAQSGSLGCFEVHAKALRRSVGLLFFAIFAKNFASFAVKTY
jgi:hypothetical protein